MTEPEQDPIIARALADVVVPEHGADFWTQLERRLDEVDAKAAAVSPAAPPGGGDRRTSTGELPSVAELHPPAAPPRRARVWFAAAAVVLVVAAVAVGALLVRDGDDGGLVPATTGETTAATAGGSTTGSVGPSTAPAPPPAPVPSPADTVAAWMNALATGDIASAADLTGPRSARYQQSQGLPIDEALRVAEEGFGSVSGSFSTLEIPLGSFDFGEVVLVVVSGTFAGEGFEGERTVVFPVVGADGDWLVEPWALSPDAGGQIAFTRPSESDDGYHLAPDAAVEVFTPVPGVAYFWVDEGDDGVRPVETSPVGANDDPFARHDPPGELADGAHGVIVGFVSPDGEVLLGQALSFAVP